MIPIVKVYNVLTGEEKQYPFKTAKDARDTYSDHICQFAMKGEMTIKTKLREDAIIAEIYEKDIHIRTVIFGE